MQHYIIATIALEYNATFHNSNNCSKYLEYNATSHNSNNCFKHLEYNATLHNSNNYCKHSDYNTTLHNTIITRTDSNTSMPQCVWQNKTVKHLSNNRLNTWSTMQHCIIATIALKYLEYNATLHNSNNCFKTLRVQCNIA